MRRLGESGSPSTVLVQAHARLRKQIVLRVARAAEQIALLAAAHVVQGLAGGPGADAQMLIG
ncbi:MAG: hypothetical protein JF591_23510 [Lysobacter sp.]|nr:hypothetical protein [Lysobacter sp.]